MNETECQKCHKNLEDAGLETWWKFSGHSFNKVLVNSVSDIVLCTPCAQEVLNVMGIKWPQAAI